MTSGLRLLQPVPQQAVCLALPRSCPRPVAGKSSSVIFGYLIVDFSAEITQRSTVCQLHISHFMSRYLCLNIKGCGQFHRGCSFALPLCREPLSLASWAIRAPKAPRRPLCTSANAFDAMSNFLSLQLAAGHGRPSACIRRLLKGIKRRYHGRRSKSNPEHPRYRSSDLGEAQSNEDPAKHDTQ